VALTVGQLVAFLTVDDRGLQQGVARAGQTMDQAARSITQTTERAGQAAGQNLAQGVGSGAQDAARLATQNLGNMAQQAGQAGTQAGQRAGQGLSQGLGQAAQQAGQQAGRQLDASLGQSAAQAGQRAAQQAGQGLSGITGGAAAAGTQAGAALDHSLGAIAQNAGRAAGQDAGQALTQQMAQAGEEAGAEGGEGLAEGLDAGTVGVAAAAAALGAIFIAGFAEAMEQGQLSGKLQAQLGTSDAVAAEHGEIAGRLYSSTLAESFEQGTQAIRNVMQAGLVPSGATNEQIESISRKVLTLARTFDVDLGQAAVAAGQLMRTGMAANATEALDVISRAFQLSDQRGDDMLDTLQEYPTHFRDLGLSADDALGIMQQGLEGAVRDTDFVADALKELTIRVQDLSAAPALEKLGLDADEMAAAFAKGGPVAKQALDQILDRLRTSVPATERYALSQQILGTKSEDLSKALLAIDPSAASAKMAGFAGTVDRQTAALTENAGANLEKFKRTVSQNVTEFIGGEVIPRLMGLGAAAKGLWEGMPDEGKAVIQVLALATVAVAGVTLAFTLGRAAVNAYQSMLAALSAQASVTSVAMRTLQMSMGFLGIALVAATGFMALFSKAKKDNTAIVREGTEAVERDSGVISKNSKEWALNRISRDGALASAERMHLSLQDVTEAAQGNAEAQARVNAAMKNGASTWAALEQTYKAQGKTWTDFLVDQVAVTGAIEDTSGALAAGTEEWRRQHEAAGMSAEQAKETAAQQSQVTKAAEDQEKAIKDLKDSWDALNGKALDSMQAQDDLEASVDDLTASIEENGRTLDAGSEKGRANRAAIREMIEASYAMSKAKLEETGSEEAANAVLATQRERFRAVMEQMGYTQDEIASLIQHYFRIPGEVGTDVRAQTSQAEANVAYIQRQLNSLEGTYQAYVTVNASQVAENVARIRAMLQSSGGVIQFVDGGLRLPKSIRAYAEGQHIAQIARAGDWRVWAEPETGGEAYIPLGAAKRSRSTAILADVAGRFGYSLAPASKTVGGPALVGAGMAMAGTAAAAASGSSGGRSVTVHIDNYYADGQSEQGVAESLWWEATKRGA
jgi:phage-related minor tail protein